MLNRSIYVLFLLVALLTTNLYSQNCSFSVNETDEFTGARKVELKQEKIVNWMFTLKGGLARIDTTYILRTWINSMSFNDCIVKDKPSLLIKMENNEVANLIALDTECAMMRSSASYVYEVTFLIPQSELEKLIVSPIKLIRIQGEKTYQDIEKIKIPDYFSGAYNCISSVW